MEASNASGKNATESPTKLKLVEYDESDSSNDSTSGNQQTNNEENTVNVKCNSSDSEKSEDGYGTSKQLSAQDINLIIMGGSEKPPVSLSEEIAFDEKKPNDLSIDTEEKILETELIQITEIDFNKLPLDDELPAELETQKTVSSKVDETDDELEFFDCESDTVQSKNLETIQEVKDYLNLELESVKEDSKINSLKQIPADVKLEETLFEEKLEDCVVSTSDPIHSDDKQIDLVVTSSEESIVLQKQDDCSTISSEENQTKFVDTVEMPADIESKDEPQNDYVVVNSEEFVTDKMKESFEMELKRKQEESSGNINITNKPDIALTEVPTVIAFEEQIKDFVDSSKDSTIKILEESLIAEREKKEVCNLVDSEKQTLLDDLQIKSVDEVLKKAVVETSKEQLSEENYQATVIDGPHIKEIEDCEDKKKEILSDEEAVTSINEEEQVVSILSDKEKKDVFEESKTNLEEAIASTIDEKQESIVKENIQEEGKTKTLSSEEDIASTTEEVQEETLVPEAKDIYEDEITKESHVEEIISSTTEEGQEVCIDVEEKVSCEEKRTKTIGLKEALASMESEREVSIVPDVKKTEICEVEKSKYLDLEKVIVSTNEAEQEDSIVPDVEMKEVFISEDSSLVKLDQHISEDSSLVDSKVTDAVNLIETDVIDFEELAADEPVKVGSEISEGLRLDSSEKIESADLEEVSRIQSDNFRAFDLKSEEKVVVAESLPVDLLEKNSNTIALEETSNEPDVEKPEVIGIQNIEKPNDISIADSDKSLENLDASIRSTDLIKCSNLLDETIESETSTLVSDELDTSLDNRKVEPLRLSLSQKPNLKRHVQEASSSVPAKVSKSIEYESIPKLMIKKMIENESMASEKADVEIEKLEVVPKLTIKTSVDPEIDIIPKLTLKLPIHNKELSSGSETDETKTSDETDDSKFSDEAQTIPKLTLKKPLDEAVDHVSSTQTIPKLTIRTCDKSKEVVTKLTLKLNDQATSSTDEQKVPKLTLRIPAEEQTIADSTGGQLSKETSESEYEEEVVQQSVPKLTIKLSSEKEQEKVVESVPKLMIKLPESEAQQIVPKLTIKLASDKDDINTTAEEKNLHQIVSKITLKKDQNDSDKVNEHVIPKLTIKLPSEKENSDLLTEEKSSHQIIPKITIKKDQTDSDKSGEQHIVPKLTIKLPSEKEDTDLPAEEKTVHQIIPKITIKKDHTDFEKSGEQHVVPKLTIKLPSEKEDTDLPAEEKTVHQNIPKITIMKDHTDSEKSGEQHVVPKLTIKLPSEKDDIDKKEDKTISKISIKESDPLVPKLTVKLSSTGEHHVSNPELIQRLSSKASFVDSIQLIPKVTIKPIVKHDLETPTKQIKIDNKSSPRVLIKPLPEKDLIPKLTLKLPSDLSIDMKNDSHHSRDMPKFTIKPIPPATESDPSKPLEIVTSDKITESGQESPRIILKINKTIQGNSTSEILSPSPDVANAQCRSPSIDKIKLKLSKTGQHPHIVHEEQDANAMSMKRALMNPDLDVIEVKRTCIDPVYTRLPPDVSISPIKQTTQEKQSEKQKSEKRLRDILSKLHKISTEQPQSQVQKLDEANDNSSSSGDCILIEDDATPSGINTKPVINFGRDIELIRIASETGLPSPNVMTPNRGTTPRKRGRPRKDPNSVAIKKDAKTPMMFGDSPFPSQHMLEGLMNSTDSPVRSSRRSTRGRSSLAKGGLVALTGRGRGRGRGSKLLAQQAAMQQQRIQQLLALNEQLLQQHSSAEENNQALLTAAELWKNAAQQNVSGESPETFLNKINTLAKQYPQVALNLDPLQNLQALTSSIPIDLTGGDDSTDAIRPTTPDTLMQAADCLQQEKTEGIDVSVLSPQGISTTPVMKTPGFSRAPRARRARGARGTRGSVSPKKRNSTLKEKPLPMFEEDTRMSADLGQKVVVPTPTKSGMPDAADESQSSMQSSANENSKSKRGRMEVGDSDGKVEFTVDMIAEYMWPQPELASPLGLSNQQINKEISYGLNNNSTSNGVSNNYDEKIIPEMYMIQEQIAMYLGVTSFKRKYPDVRRRQVEMRERDYIMSKNLVKETLCDLGLTAIPTCEVLDIMSADFPQKYDEYKKYQRDKQAKELAIKQRQMNSDRNKQRSIKDRAISSASSWNTNFNKERLDSRKGGCLDLQTYIIQRGKSTQFVRPASKTRPGNYPVALVPGQYCDYYKKYSPNELRYFPLDTVLYGPQKPNQRSQEIIMSQVSDSSESSSSSSGSDSDSSSDDSEDETTCRLCQTVKPGQEFVHCSGCKFQVHTQCTGLLSRESIVLSKTYPWRCINCKQCLQCLKSIKDFESGDAAKVSKNVLRCERCDRCAHVSCVSNSSLNQNSKWFCTMCSVCDSCGSANSNNANNDNKSMNMQWRRVDTPRGARQLCHNCALMWQEKLYCSMCYLCVLDNQRFMSCKICCHKIHTDCIRTQFPNMTGNETVTCLDCSKKSQNLPKALINSLTVAHHQQQQTVTTTC